MQCPACQSSMREIHTPQGVLVDRCPACNGIWFDEGEIFLFTRQPKWLYQALAKGLDHPHPSQRSCPRCQAQLEEGGFITPELQIDHCPACQGLWFDDRELEQALRLGKRKFEITLPGENESARYAHAVDDPERKKRWQESRTSGMKSKQRERLEALRARLLPLPSLALRSTMCFVLLYGFLAFILLVIGEFAQWPLSLSCGLALGIIVVQYAIGPWVMDWLLAWMHNCSWIEIEELPEHLQRFLRQTCQSKRMKLPSIGLIHDGNPNAFTYGHTPNDARVVITQGILNLLEPEEIQAVVAHELGHAYHWDILVMTLASMVPVILYAVYRFFMEASDSRGKEKGGNYALIIAFTAYLLYIAAEYIVLWLSRTREYWADRFAGEVTQKPNSLSNALVKIAYGLVASREQKEKEPAARLEAIRALGIFDHQAAAGLILQAYPGKVQAGQAGQPVDKERIADAMQWDLWNPWAAYYELHSTHPLPAKRINALSEQAAAMDQEPFLIFERKKPESYWDEFLVDIVVHHLPNVPLILWFGYILTQVEVLSREILLGSGGVMVGATALAYALKILFSYRGEVFPATKIASILGKVKVSGVRPVPVTLRGKIIGRGVPGYLFSEDLVLQDETGIIFLDYRQPLWIIEFFFALLRTGKYIGKDVIIQGWYRRAPIPFVEIKTLRLGNDVHTCYVYFCKWLVVGLLSIISAVFLLQAAGSF